MSEIRLARAHRLPVGRVKAIAQSAADELARRFQTVSEWNGDTLHIRRAGIEGLIEISPTQIALEIRLGLVLRAWRRSIEKQASERLDRLLAGADPAG